MADSSTGYVGQQGLSDSASDHNIRRFHIDQTLDERRTMIPVKVVAVHGGGVGAAPTVDVLPLIDQVDGLGTRTAHGTIYNIPTSRSQSANGAVINDPQPGDWGMMHIADRDISGLKASGIQSAPGSQRRGGLGDGIFHGAVLIPAPPKQYLMLLPDGVTVADQYGNIIETHSDRVNIIPKQGNTIYVGGDGVKGTYDFLLTPSGPSINTKTRTG